MAQQLAPEAAKMNEAFEHDEAQFRAKLPYALTPTALKGVYVNPTPPAGFDPKTASQHDLIKHGIMVRKPTAEDPPEMQQEWENFFSRNWQEKDRIVPQFEVHVGKSHILRTPPEKQSNTSYYTNAWAGAVKQGGVWTTCIGTWTIPTVSKPTEAQGTEGGWNSSSWVGIDGFNSLVSSNDVLQAGIEQRVDKNGNPSYQAWYEWYAPVKPNSPPYVWEVGIPNMPVAAGQSVSCVVQYQGTTAGMLTFTNNTTGVHFSITLAPPPGATFKGNTAEWIMEAPDTGEPTSSLPKFTPVAFTSCRACGPNNIAVDPSGSDTVNVRNAQNKVLTATTTALYTTTVSFIG